MDLKKENTLPLICKRCQTRFPAGNRYCICGGLLYTKEGLDFERVVELFETFAGLGRPRKEKQ